MFIIIYITYYIVEKKCCCINFKGLKENIKFTFFKVVIKLGVMKQNFRQQINRELQIEKICMLSNILNEF
jgi:hypothetical protein